MGYGVPTVCFGEGVGLRRDLGLLRVVIPADKEIMLLTVPSSNVDPLVELIKKTARLNIPGRGIIFVKPIRAMNVNIRIYQAVRRHAATLDQIITSMDILRGSTDWRTRSDYHRSTVAKGKKHCSVILIADEKSFQDSVQEALISEVGGATGTSYNWHSYDDDKKDLLTYQTKEGCEMIVEEGRKRNVLSLIEESGFCDNEVGGILEITELDAFIYRDNSRRPHE